MPQSSYRIDVEGLLTAFGGAKNYERKASAAGMKTVGYKGMRQWVRRGRIPMGSLCQMLVFARVSNLDLDLYDYIVPVEE